MEPVRRERLETRITDAQKELFKKAAAFEGKSLSEFVVSTLQDAARRIVQEHEVMVLSERDREIFIEALLNPPKPNRALREAAKAHKRMIGRR